MMRTSYCKVSKDENANEKESRYLRDSRGTM
jgi:hypothetical protein